MSGSDISNLTECIKEILDWHKTGFLTGSNLRTLASEIRERHGLVFDQGEALRQAEEHVKRECMRIVLARSEHGDETR